MKFQCRINYTSKTIKFQFWIFVEKNFSLLHLYWRQTNRLQWSWCKISNIADYLLVYPEMYRFLYWKATNVGIGSYSVCDSFMTPIKHPVSTVPQTEQNHSKHTTLNGTNISLYFKIHKFYKDVIKRSLFYGRHRVETTVGTEGI